MKSALGSGAMLGTVLLASTALASFTEAQAQKLWGKYAVGFFEKPKMGCVCFDGPNNFKLGTLVQVNATTAACYLTTFDSEGVSNVQSPCNGMFAPLAK